MKKEAVDEPTRSRSSNGQAYIQDVYVTSSHLTKGASICQAVECKHIQHGPPAALFGEVFAFGLDRKARRPPGLHAEDLDDGLKALLVKPKI